MDCCTAQGLNLLVHLYGRKKVADVIRRVESLPIEVPSWGFGRGGTRFASYPSPGIPKNIAQKLASAAMFHEITGKGATVALHFPWDGTSPADIAAIAQHLKKAGLAAGTINLNLFSMRPKGALNERMRFGTLTSPLAEVRRAAVQHGIECIRIMRKLKSKTIVLWLPDGTNSPGQMSLYDQADRLEETAKQICKGLRAGEKMLVEYKLFEPGFYSTAIQDYGRSRSLCRMLGPKARVLVDLGHHAQGTNVEHIIALLVREGDLGGFHFNDSTYADDDLATGSLNPGRLFRIMCTLVEGEIRGYQRVNKIAFMIDQSHNIKDPLQEMIESTENIETAYAKALLVDWNELKKAQDRCDASEADAILRDAFLTDVRPILSVLHQGKE